MNEKFAYPASVVRDEAGYYLVTFPDFPEAATDGATREGALEEAPDALEEAIAGRMNRGDAIPHPGTRRARQALVPVPAQMAVKAALYIAVKETGIRNTELARRLDADEKEIRRLLDPHHRSKLPRLEEALKAMGKKLVIGIEAHA